LGLRAFATSARGTADSDLLRGQSTHSLQLLESSADRLVWQAGATVQFIGCQRTVVDGGKDALEWPGAHVSTRPIWKMTTATTHATLNCIVTPKRVHRRPISRHWVASVATHGV
jgi:hypothetical protein